MPICEVGCPLVFSDSSRTAERTSGFQANYGYFSRFTCDFAIPPNELYAGEKNTDLSMPTIKDSRVSFKLGQTLIEIADGHC